jgi:hypothetical protein
VCEYRESYEARNPEAGFEEKVLNLSTFGDGLSRSSRTV